MCLKFLLLLKTGQTFQTLGLYQTTKVLLNKIMQAENDNKLMLYPNYKFTYIPYIDTI